MPALLQQYQKQLRYLSIFLTLISGIVLIGLQLKPEGWFILLAATLILLLTDKKFAKDLLLVNISLIFLGLLEINTNISYGHMFSSGVWISLAVAAPYTISRFIYNDTKIRFSFGSPKDWNKTHYTYIGLALVLSYLLVPFYLTNTGAYMNWPSATDPSSIVRLFFGTNALGIWDELYFIIIVLSVLKHYMKFWHANIAQALLWTAFLYELGFTGWGPIFIYGFALLQGWIFQKTDSLLYTLTIHLSLDFVLFISIIHSHHTDMINIFIT